MISHVSPKATVFNYNGDFSGMVTIRPAKAEFTVDIPAEDILAFVAHAYVCAKRIGKLEQMEWEELLA